MFTYAPTPPIIISATEHRQLLTLALASTGPETGDELLGELDRAQVVPETDLPPDVVRMGSTATYRTSDRLTRTVTLVYPAQADISLGRISVLTPVGTALIGLRYGHSIT